MSGYRDSLTGEMLMCGSPDTVGCLAIEIRKVLGDFYLPGGYHEVCCKRMLELATERKQPELAEKLTRVHALLKQAYDILEPTE
jgi:hypothetical protein